MRAYSVDLRERVLTDLDEGMSKASLARKYRVSTRWIYKLQKQRDQTGDIKPRKGRDGPKRKLAEHTERLLQLVKDQPDATLAELRDQLGVTVSITTLWSTLKRLGVTFKKVLHAAEQDREDVAQRRRLWKFWQAHLHQHQLVFIDETGANTKRTRLGGRSFRGERVVSKVPHGHWKTTTFVGALRSTGITAPLVVDGPMNGEMFLAYVPQQLVPTLRKGDTVILDNLSSHKRAGVKEAIEAVGARLVYLPPYRPDLNPIELAFAKLKALLRRAAARTVDELQSTIAQLIDRFSTKECLAYFRHRGYSAR